MGAKISVLGLITSFPPHLRSAMVRFPFNILVTSHLFTFPILYALRGGALYFLVRQSFMLSTTTKNHAFYVLCVHMMKGDYVCIYFAFSVSVLLSYNRLEPWHTNIQMNIKPKLQWHNPTLHWPFTPHLNICEVTLHKIWDLEA